jgi:hypothetical protein
VRLEVVRDAVGFKSDIKDNDDKDNRALQISGEFGTLKALMSLRDVGI